MFAVQVSHKMIVSNLFQLERDVDFPPVALGDLNEFHMKEPMEVLLFIVQIPLQAQIYK